MNRIRTYLISASALVMLLLASSCLPVQDAEVAPEANIEADSQASEAVPVPIDTSATEGVDPAFDIVQAKVGRDGAFLVFQQVVVGEVGSVIPAETGQLAGAGVESYVWPTSLNSAAVGFEEDQGILALGVTAHPDFDDTPQVDEDGDGDVGNDGRLWHSHWVVLVEDEACGPGGLKVRDIPEGETPAVPNTWPELPLLIDSPNYELELAESTVSVRIPFQRFEDGVMFNYDGVAAGLRVNVDLHAPLLCVSGVYDIASGDLSLPGLYQ